MDCYGNVEKALKDLYGEEGISPKKARNIVEEIETLKKYTKNLDLNTQKKVFDEFYTGQRTAALNNVKNKISLTRVSGNFDEKVALPELKNKPILILDDILRDTDRSIKSYSNSHLGMLESGLREVNALNNLKDVNFLKDLVTEMAHSGKDGTPGISKNPLALEALKAFKKVTNSLHSTGLSLGLDWAYVDNYIPTIWDESKVIGQSEEAFVADFKQHLNKKYYPGRTDQDLENMLKSFYKDLSLRNYDEILQLPDSTVVRQQYDSLAKKMLESRKIHLTPEGIVSLYDKYGAGTENFANNFYKFINAVSRKFGLIENFGSNPSAGFEVLLNKIKKANPEKFETQASQLRDLFEYYRNPYKYGTGKSKKEFAGELIRGAAAATALTPGSALTAQLTDPGMFAGWILSRVGDNMASGVQDYFSSLATVLSKESRKEVADILGVVMDTELKQTMEHLGIDLQPKLERGKVGNALATNINRLNNLSLLPFQQGLSLNAALSASSAIVGKYSGKAFDQLPIELQTTLNRNKINAEEWDIIRSNVQDYKGNKLVSPTNIRANKSIKNAIDVSHKATKLLYNLQEGVVVPSTREKIIFSNKPQDTVSGQIWKMIGLFKTYPIASWNKAMQMYNYNPKAPTKGNYAVVAQTMVGLASLMLINKIMKDSLVNNKKTNLKDPSVWGEIILSSGIGGLYADVLFTDYNKYAGVTIGSKLAGPALGKTFDMYEVVQDLLDGNKDMDKKKLALFNQFVKNIPLRNTPLIKPTLDYAILNAVYDEIDPGHRARKMQQFKKQKKTIFGTKLKNEYLFDIGNKKMF